MKLNFGIESGKVEILPESYNEFVVFGGKTNFGNSEFVYKYNLEN